MAPHWTGYSPRLTHNAATLTTLRNGSRPSQSHVRAPRFNPLRICQAIVVSLSASERGCFTTDTLVITEHLGQLIRRHLERPGTGAFAGHRLRIGRGARCVEGDVTFDLLHDLMDVPVQHRHRAEAAQLIPSADPRHRCPSPTAHRWSKAACGRRPRSACWPNVPSGRPPPRRAVRRPRCRVRPV